MHFMPYVKHLECPLNCSNKHYLNILKSYLYDGPTFKKWYQKCSFRCLKGRSFFFLFWWQITSGFGACYSYGLIYLCLVQLVLNCVSRSQKRWTALMMSGPLRYLSRILEVCWDIIETSVTENFWFYRCPVKTRSSSFLPLIQSLWKFVIIAGLVMMSPCWFFALSLFVPHRHFIDMTSIVTVNILLKYFSSSRWNYRVNYMAKQLFLSEMVWLAPPSCPHQIQCPDLRCM